LYSYVIMSNHIHLVVQQKDEKLADWVRGFKKFTSKKLLKMILINPYESRKEWLKMIFDYQAKFNKRVGPNSYQDAILDTRKSCNRVKSTGYYRKQDEAYS